MNPDNYCPINCLPDPEPISPFNEKATPHGCGKGSFDSRKRSPRFKKTRSGAMKPLRRRNSR